MVYRTLVKKLSWLLCLSILGQIQVLFAQRISVTDSLENLLNISDNDSIRIQIMAQLSREYESNFPDKAILYAKDGLKKAQEINYEKGTGLCLRSLGIIEWYQSNYEAALENEQKAQAIFEKIGYKKGLAEVLNTIAVIFHSQSNYTRAFDYYLKALKIREEIKDQSGAARCLSNIGTVFQVHNDIDKALSYKIKAINIYRKIKDSSGLAEELADIGVLYTLKKDYVQALKNLEESTKLYEKWQSNKVELSQNLEDTGIIFEEQKKYDLALFYLHKALDLKQELGYELGIATTWKTIARVQKEMGLYESASDNALKALKIFNKIGNKYDIRETSLILTETFKKMKMFDKSLQYYELANIVQDSIFSIEKNRLINNMEANHQIELLTKDKALKEIELEKKNLNLWLLVGGSVLISLVALLFMLNFYHVRKMYEVQKQQALEIGKQNEEIARKNHELSIMNMQLDQKVQERTAVLEFQNRQLKQYAFINSHRLRSPVATILGLLEILSMNQSVEEEKKIKEYLKVSAQELDNIVHLIKDTIDTSQYPEN
jgi:tetratricopeptide (TPR) repeat protein